MWKIVRAAKLMCRTLMRSTKSQKFQFYNILVTNPCDIWEQLLDEFQGKKPLFFSWIIKQKSMKLKIKFILKKKDIERNSTNFYQLGRRK